MEISTPECRTILTEDNYGMQDREQMWQISTTDDKSLVWSILMSYLFSTSEKVTNDNLYEIVGILQYDVDEEKAFSHAKALEILLEFNPFINRKDFYSIPMMKNLLNNFEQRLESFIVLEDDRKFHVEQLLHSASTLLRCRIDIYSTDNDADVLNYSGTGLTMSFGRDYFRNLILFRKHRTLITSSFDVFSFGISPESARLLRQCAWCHITENFQIPEEISRKFKNAVSKENDFLTRLIRHGYSKDIHYLLLSPLAIEKLSEACLNIDPLKTDKHGFSAFYYCMGCTDTSVLRLLYNYATRNIFTDDDKLRKPNSKSLEILKEIGYVIRKDCSKSNDFSTLGHRKEFAVRLCRQLLQFNQYQISVVREIVEISKTEIDAFIKQLYITISTLDYYDEYFYFGNITEDDMFNNYIEFAEYYDNLDCFNHFLLFDNIVSTTMVADENNKSVFTNAINSSFLLILSRKMFPRKENHFCSTNVIQNIKNNYLQFIPLTYRIEFQSLARDLSKELKMLIKQNREPNTESFDVIRQSLWELPEVKNELISTRIKNYISISVKTTHKTLNSKNSLALERTIQVIGELVCSHNESDCISHAFLCSWFPKEMVSAFGLMRHHCFSHYRASSVQGRMNLELNQFETVDQIQKEIFNVHRVFEPITECFMLEMQDLMFKRGMQYSLERYPAIFRLMAKQRLAIKRKKFKHYEVFKKYYIILSRNLLRYISESLEVQKTRQHGGQYKKSEPKLKDMKSQFEALIYLSNYISECLRFNFGYSTKLKINVNKLEGLIKNYSEYFFHEVKEDIQCILKEANWIYDNIWKNYKLQLSKKNMKIAYRSIGICIDDFYKHQLLKKRQINSVENEINNSVSLKKTLLIFFSQTFKKENSHKRTFRYFKRKLEKLAEWITNRLTINEIDILVHQLQFDFEIITNKLNALDENPYEISFNSDLLNKYFSDMKGHNVFSQEEEYEIKSAIYQHLMVSNESKKNLANHLDMAIEKKTILENFNHEKILKNIVMVEKKRNSIISLIKDSKFQKAAKLVKSLRNEETTQFESAENVTSLLQQILENEKYRIMLLRINFPPELQKKVNQFVNQKLHFLISRINLMKNILIDDDVQIKGEWIRAKTHCEERHMKMMMRQKYVTEDETRAALEMLIFDCFNILQDKDLEELWKKRCNLFSGINLRDFLAHGSPVIEEVANSLDPNDFPMEFINKILELISDCDAMNALLELWEKLESRKFSDLKDIINMDCDDEYNSLRSRIKSSNRTESEGRPPRWEKYLKVLNLDIDTSTWS